MKTTIAVASHIEYPMPEDPVYMPVLAGAVLYREESGGSLPDGFIGDDTRDNISLKNRSFCELSVLYWLWKNVSCDIAGLCHYRRYFASPSGDRKIISEKEIASLLDKSEIILPARRKYYIETNHSQYIHAHHAEDLDLTRRIIQERCPEYLESYDEVMKRRWGHRFNMMICRKKLLDAYCEWLFDILFELEVRLDTSGYSARDRRVFGYVSERLLDVWVRRNHVSYVDVPYIMTERENLPAKAVCLICRKIRALFRRKV